MTDPKAPAAQENWFIHVLYFDAADPEDPVSPDPPDKAPWLITIDHCYHSGRLPDYVGQYCREGSPTGGFGSAQDVVRKLKEILAPVKRGTRPPPPQYVHKRKSDGSVIVNTVYSTSTSYLHCPSDAAGKPVYPGYPANDATISDVVACMMAGKSPPCLRGANPPCQM